MFIANTSARSEEKKALIARPVPTLLEADTAHSRICEPA